MNKTSWLSGLAAMAILGAGAAPVVASAQGSSSTAAVDIEASAGPKGARLDGLAALLGIDAATLQAAMKAAAEATPRPEDKRDTAARDAYLAAFNANLAAGLGISLDTLAAAQAQVKVVRPEKARERPQAAEEQASRHFQELLARLVGAGVLTQAQADEALAQYQLGGREQAQVIKRIRSLVQDEKAEQQFQKLLTRLVEAGLLTQAQADEALAQYLLGGEPKGQIVKRLRALIQGEKEDRRGEQRSDRKRAEPKNPGLERTPKVRPGNPA